MKDRSLWAAALPAVLLASVSCEGWTATSHMDQLAWADDDSEIAIVELAYEERAGDALSGTTEKRGFSHRLYRASPDGQNRSPVGGERAGHSGADLHFMKSAGYLLVSTVLEGGELRYSRVDLPGGEETPIPPGTGDLQSNGVLPSPDGARIARVSVEGTAVSVELLDADSLAELATRGTAPSLAGSPSWTWREDGAFVVTDGTEAYALEPESLVGFTETEVPGCTFPKTTSSPISSEGAALSTDPTGTAIEVGAADEAAAFGCQSEG